MSRKNEPDAPEISNQPVHSDSRPNAAEKPPSEAAVKPQPVSHPAEPSFLLDGQTLPVSLLATHEFSLLNAAGKETPVLLNTEIKVTQRSATGILTMEINNASFVGSESRLAGNVRMIRP
jgi:hypothetical protein